MKNFRWTALSLLVLAGTAGCAPSQSLIVLLPDPDGQVGEIHVHTDSGDMAVTQAYQAVAIHPEEAPTPPRPIDKEKIETRFGPALTAEPAQRFRFEKLTFYCRKDSPELIPESQDEWPEAVRRLIESRPEDIYVVGHTDRVGTERYNRQLSRMRSLVIEQKLVAGGVNARIILISFLGESQPQVKTPDEFEEPLNRRVVLIAKYKKSR